MYNSSTGSNVIFSFIFVCYCGLLYIFSIALNSKWKKVVFVILLKYHIFTFSITSFDGTTFL